MRLKGQVAIITGSSRGIGKAIALAFVDEGCAVVINSRSFDKAEKVAQEILKKGGRALGVEADVTQQSSVTSMVQKTIEAFGRIDILVNNAGVPMVCPAIELKEEDWDKTLTTDLKAYFLCSQAIAKIMIPQRKGKIINITSMLGETVVPGRIAYTVSKAGADMLTKALAVEWAKYHINVNAIAPGYVMTEWIEDLIKKGVLKEDTLIRRTPLKRLPQVEDVSKAAVFLASNESDYITGEILRVDGGWVLYGGWDLL